MQTIQNTIIGTLQSVKERLERDDEEIANCPKVFSAPPVDQISQSEKTSQEVQPEE